MASPAQAVQPAEKSSKLPLILGIVLALAGAGGGFFVMYSGLLDSVLGSGTGDSHAAEDSHGSADPHATDSHAAPADSHGATETAAGGITFVPMEPITINLGPRSDSRHLRFSAQLEVPVGQAAEVQRLMPRIMDVVNIYLRALDPHEIEEPAALLRLRGQMLRRVRIVAGPGAINDLLVIEFVFN